MEFYHVWEELGEVRRTLLGERSMLNLGALIMMCFKVGVCVCGGGVGPGPGPG